MSVSGEFQGNDALKMVEELAENFDRVKAEMLEKAKEYDRERSNA